LTSECVHMLPTQVPCMVMLPLIADALETHRRDSAVVDLAIEALLALAYVPANLVRSVSPVIVLLFSPTLLKVSLHQLHTRTFTSFIA
jgi:hypothetical protein